MATVEPGGTCIWRMELNTVTPAQSMGAYVAASTSGGMWTAASERMVQYSASMIKVSEMPISALRR